MNCGENSSIVTDILPFCLLKMPKVQRKANESWGEPIYSLVMPAENILQSGRPVLHAERGTLEDDTTGRFAPDAIESCLIIPVEILLS
jgi:hypothetical protein